VTTGKVIDAVLLVVRQRTTTSTGTVKVALNKGGVEQASVTVNKTDLPTFNGALHPVLFKLTGTATGDGGANWTVVLTPTGSGDISYYYSGSAFNLTRALRTTTTQAPAAADDLYIVGELTGAATKNTRTVTMDSTAATVYGNGAINNNAGIHISNWGTLTYAGVGGSTPATFDGVNSAQITTSNGGRKATVSGTVVAHIGARSATTMTTGKYYFELTLNQKTAATFAGVLLSTGTYTDMNGGQNSFEVADSGDIYSQNNFQSKNIGAVVTNDVVGFAIDLTARLCWVRRNNGTWNASGTADPATGVGGITIDAGAFAPAVCFAYGYVVGDAWTGNFGQAAFANAAPSGFGNWATTVAGGGNYILRVAGDVIVYQYGTLNMGSSAGGSGYGTLDTATASNVTLSNGNLTVTSTGTTANEQGARVAATKTTGKYYFEATIVAGGSFGVAVCTAASTYTNLNQSGATTGVVMFCFNGQIWSAGANSGSSLGGRSVGDKISVAVDLDNRTIWFRVAPSGNWNGSGTADPATNVGGVTIPAGAMLPAFCFNTATTSGTGNFGATAFTGTVPSGFTSGWDVTNPASTAILEFQQVSADGDFGLRCLDNSTVTITGQPRTAGKNVVKCKLTADVAGAGNVLTATSGSLGTIPSNAGLDASGNSLLANGFTDNSTSGVHAVNNTGPSINNTTQTGSVWLARGSGLNNRYVRVYVGNNTAIANSTSGFYSDIDLQAGTAGTVTAVGTGVATSVSITAVGVGYLVRITGKVSTVSNTPNFALIACSAAGTTTYAGNTTQCFIYDHVALVTTASMSDTVFNVDADTGWLNGDAVCVASTTRTAAECEIFPLNANAGASSFTSALYPFGLSNASIWSSTHHGTAPIQAEIGLLTRNVKIRSTSPTLMSYVYCTALATVTASWAEFYYFGANAIAKRGIEIDGGVVANPKSFTYCSIHDNDFSGVYCVTSTVTSLNLVLSNNVFWLQTSGTPAMVTISGTVAKDDWTFDSNLVMRCGGAGFNLSDIGGTFSNNTVVGQTNSYSFNLTEVGSAIKLGNFDNNTCHSTGAGLSVAAWCVGTIRNFTAWRCTFAGVQYNYPSTRDLTLENLTIFGCYTNTTTGSFHVSGGDGVNIKGGVIAGDSLTTCSWGIRIQPEYAVQFNVNNLDMSGVGGAGIYRSHLWADIALNGGTTGGTPCGVFNDCKFSAPLLTTPTYLFSPFGAALGFQRCNEVAADHRTESGAGQLRLDGVVYRTQGPSLRMMPISSFKLESAPSGRGIQVKVVAGSTVAASVYVRKDASYRGAQPRLLVRANPAMGLDVDTVLATCSGTSGATVPARWNNVAPYIVLSNNNLTISNLFGNVISNEMGARVSSPIGDKTSGKWYFEIKYDTVTGVTTTFVIGIGTPGTGYLTWGSTAVNAVGVQCYGGYIFSNNVYMNIQLGNIASGQVIGIAVDLDARLAWFRLAPTGNWNANASYNPATGVGGVPIPPGMMVPFNTMCAGGGLVPGNIFTANFGASAFTGAVPSGFTSGWTVPQGTGTGAWELLSGTTSVLSASDVGALEFYVDCDGVDGFVNVDDWSFTTNGVTTTNNLSNWFNALPVTNTEGGGGASGGYFSAGFV
jgi:hypothetical protein